MQEIQRSWSVVQAWTCSRVQVSSHALSVTEEQTTTSTAVAANTECIRNAAAPNGWYFILIRGVHSAREPPIQLKKVRELLPVLTSRHLSYKTCGHLHSSCMQRELFHVSETWPRGYKTWVHFGLKIKRNDWLLADTCPQAANHWALFWAWDCTQVL